MLLRGVWVKLRVYLDTSVFSAYYDYRLVDRQTLTGEFWKRLDEFEVSTSQLTRLELLQTNDVSLKDNLDHLLETITLHSITDDMRDLANHYVSANVFSPTMFNDALHVAAATMTRQDVILSWNFRHLVNRRRRAQINQINIMLELPMSEIMAPPEI